MRAMVSEREKVVLLVNTFERMVKGKKKLKEKKLLNTSKDINLSRAIATYVRKFHGKYTKKSVIL